MEQDFWILWPLISSTYFPRKDIHKPARVSHDGKTCNQIDHIAIDKEHWSCIKKHP